MDRIISYLKQYRVFLLVLVLGIGLMLLPVKVEEKADAEPQPEKKEETMEERLESILSSIQQVGRAEVMLSVAAGEETLYQMDTDESYGDSSDTKRSDVVIITNSQRAEQGLVKQRNPPIYQGAIIVCQGGDNPSVRLAVVEAVASVTGLTSDKITVLKMK